MATRYSTRTFCKTQSPVSSYKRNNRLVTEGYDSENCRYWFRIDFGQVREFKSRAAMEAALEAEFAPAPSRALAEVAREDALANFDRWCRLYANLVNGKTLAPREFYFRSAELAKYEQQTALAVSRLAQAWSMAL